MGLHLSGMTKLFCLRKYEKYVLKLLESKRIKRTKEKPGRLKSIRQKWFKEILKRG